MSVIHQFFVLFQVCSPIKDVSAKDIVSGIISAAKRKKANNSSVANSGVGGKGSHGGGSSSSKKDSVNSNHSSTSESASYSAKAVSNTGHEYRGLVTTASSTTRRNSESVLSSAMAIVAAVPQLVPQIVGAGGGSPMSVMAQQQQPHGSRSRVAAGLTPSFASPTAVAIASAIKSSAVQGRLDGADEGHRRRGSGLHQEPEPSTTQAFPSETYHHGLDEATAERVRRFEDETMKAMLLRTSRSDLAASTTSTTTSASTSELLSCTTSSGK